MKTQDGRQAVTPEDFTTLLLKAEKGDQVAKNKFMYWRYYELAESTSSWIMEQSNPPYWLETIFKLGIKLTLQEVKWAVDNGKIDAVKYIFKVSTGINVNYYADPMTKSTLLHKAALSPKCNVELIEFLLSKNANINAQDSSNNTPLFLAVYKGNPIEKIACLIANGAEVNSVCWFVRGR